MLPCIWRNDGLQAVKALDSAPVRIADIDPSKENVKAYLRNIGGQFYSGTGHFTEDLWGNLQFGMTLDGVDDSKELSNQNIEIGVCGSGLWCLGKEGEPELIGPCRPLPAYAHGNDRLRRAIIAGFVVRRAVRAL